MPDLGSILDNPRVRRYLKDAGRDLIRRRMVAARTRIAKRLEDEGVSVAEDGKRHTIRFTLFWLWKAVVSNGHAADLIRDLHDDQVVSDVSPDIDAGTPPPEVVRLVTEAALRRI